MSMPKSDRAIKAEARGGSIGGGGTQAARDPPKPKVIFLSLKSCGTRFSLLLCTGCLSYYASLITIRYLLVCDTNTVYQRKMHRGICDFQLKSPFISEMVRDRPVVATQR